MKDFIKMTLATLAGLFLFAFAGMFLLIVFIGAAAALGNTSPILPAEGMLEIDMSSITLAEQSREADPLASLQNGGQTFAAVVGIRSAVEAVNAAAEDPAVKFIFLKPDGVTGGIAQIEEFRSALKNFRAGGKAIVSYMENPTNGGYYLASVSDRIYITEHDGGINMFCGMSTQMIFLKDILERLGVNVQLIRHGKYKSAGEMFVRSSSSEENLEQNKNIIGSVWKSWAEDIAAARGIDMNELNRMLDNLELKLPTDFVEKGLADGMVDAEELKDKLCDIYVADSFEDIGRIQFTDYVKARPAPVNKAGSKVAVIYMDGNIVDGNDRQQIAGDRFAGIISKIRKDPSVKAVVIRVNSPGGSVLASEKIKAELDLIGDDVPVVASFGDYAASGGYWISCGADHIFADKTTLTGSIGVFSLIPDFRGTLEDKLHVNVTSVNSNPHADMYTFLRPLDETELRFMQASVEHTYERFTSVVAEGRGMSTACVDSLGQGRIWTGTEAVEIGLADEDGTLEDAIRYAVMSIDGIGGMNDVQIVEYPKQPTTIEVLMETLGSSPAVFAGTALENVEQTFKGWNTSESGKVYARIPYELSIR